MGEDCSRKKAIEVDLVGGSSERPCIESPSPCSTITSSIYPTTSVGVSSFPYYL